MIDQLSVFLENENGRLGALTQKLAEANINMYALSIADTTDYGVVRIICDDPKAALEVLKENNFRAACTQVAVLSLPNEPGSLAKIFAALDKKQASIEYSYCFSAHSDTATVAIKANDQAYQVLKDAGFNFLSQKDLA